MITQTIALTPALLKNTLIASLVGALFVLVLEPEHTSSLPVFAAYGLWATHLFFGALLFLTGVFMVQRLGWRDPLPTIISTLLLPLFFALVSLILDYGFGNLDEEPQEELSVFGLFLSEIVAVAPASLAVAIALVFLLKKDAPAEATPPTEKATQSVDEPQPKPQVHLRSLIPAIPHPLGNDIIRMHAQDHYVEIVTTNGRSLLSEQFGDCLEKLSAIDGIHCHRSHWVCLAHVKDIARKGSAYSCLLSNGDEVPISRRKYAEIKSRLRATLDATDQAG